MLMKPATQQTEPEPILDDLDYRIIRATQDGLPHLPEPYHAIASQLQTSADEVMTRIRRMLANGVIRRIGVVPNHYSLGFHANGMTVWDVPDHLASEVGRELGALPYVSHCYLRPRHMPDWPYNLFAMVHGHDRREVGAEIKHIIELLGDRFRRYDVLYSRKILKKAGLRLSDREQ